MIPYGRAGAGFSLIDVTKLDQPLHLYSILNDTVGEKVHRVDHTGKVFSGSYSTSRLNENNFKEVQTAKNNATQGLPNTCNSTGNTSCYQGKKLTLVRSNFRYKQYKYSFKWKSCYKFSYSNTCWSKYRIYISK